MNRNFGLDVMRAVAILLVLIGHSFAHQHPPEWMRWLARPQGIIGVEIFYVLSGFLIGHILLRTAKAGRLRKPGDVLDFWRRRWARTLPLYFVFLFVYLRFDYLGPGNLATDWPFLVFMQNFAWRQLPFFQHSWSLAVEEWFYLILPILLVFFSFERWNYQRAVVASCFTVVVVSGMFRWIDSGFVKNLADFDAIVRSIVVCRLDSLCFGVLLALLRIERPDIYERTKLAAGPALLTVIGYVIYLGAGAPGLVSSRALQVVFFPLLSLACILVVPWLEDVKTTGSRQIDFALRYTSKVSYSLYLGHICMLSLVNAILEQIGWAPDGMGGTFAVYLAYAGAYYALATLTHEFVERPYILLRNERLGHADVRSGEVALQG